MYLYNWYTLLYTWTNRTLQINYRANKNLKRRRSRAKEGVEDEGEKERNRKK